MSLFKSKKFIMAVASVLAVVLNHFVPVIPQEAVMSVAGIVCAYLLGQGLSDLGKEAAKISKE